MTARRDAPSDAVKLRVLKRDKFRCTYCGVAGTDAELEVDHIIPVARGGSHHCSNLTSCCRACNQKKGSGDPPIAHRSARPSIDAHPLVGLWFHTFNEAGELHYQGQILALDGETALAQLYEWLAGEPGSVKPIAKSVFYSDACRLYATNEDMHAAFEEFARRERVKWEREFA